MIQVLIIHKLTIIYKILNEKLKKKSKHSIFLYTFICYYYNETSLNELTVHKIFNKNLNFGRKNCY